MATNPDGTWYGDGEWHPETVLEKCEREMGLPGEVQGFVLKRRPDTDLIRELMARVAVLELRLGIHPRLNKERVR